MGLSTDASALENGLAALLSVMQLTAYWLVGNKRAAGWWIGIAGALPWMAVMNVSGLYGLLPLVAGLQVIYIRNLRKWTKERKGGSGTKEEPYQTQDAKVPGHQ